MKQHAVRWVRILSLLVVARVSPCDEHFIMHAPSTLTPAIVTRHNLALGVPANTEGVSRVINCDARTPADVVGELTADPDVQGVEADQSTIISETASGIQLGQSTAVILDTSSIHTPVPFYGGNVWISYISQAAAVLTRVSDAQKLATGLGIVAIIDTGVDPNQPVLMS